MCVLANKLTQHNLKRLLACTFIEVTLIWLQLSLVNSKNTTSRKSNRLHFHELILNRNCHVEISNTQPIAKVLLHWFKEIHPQIFKVTISPYMDANCEWNGNWRLSEEVLFPVADVDWRLAVFVVLPVWLPRFQSSDSASYFRYGYESWQNEKKETEAAPSQLLLSISCCCELANECLELFLASV